MTTLNSKKLTPTQILCNEIDKLSNEERIALREKLLKEGQKKLPRNLYYNYSTQEWI